MKYERFIFGGTLIAQADAIERGDWSLAGGPDGVLPSAAEAPPATSDIGAYEAGVRYENERIERLIMGHDPIEPSDRAYLLELIKRK